MLPSCYSPVKNEKVVLFAGGVDSMLQGPPNSTTLRYMSHLIGGEWVNSDLCSLSQTTTFHRTSLITHPFNMTYHHSPLITDHSSLTSRHSPLNTLPSSLTHHHSHLITHPSSLIPSQLLSSLTPCYSPTVTHPSSLTLHRSPLFTHPSLLTPHHPPFITHSSSLTHYHLPLITHPCVNFCNALHFHKKCAFSLSFFVFETRFFNFCEIICNLAKLSLSLYAAGHGLQ